MSARKESAESSHDMAQPQLGSNDETSNSRSNYSRNPITGVGLNGDGVGGLKPKTAKSRAGNPVTGEGYPPGDTDFEVLRSMAHGTGDNSSGHL